MDPIAVVAPQLGGRALLGQRWRNLTFLHWRVDPARVAPLLPAGTHPDVFDGSTWVGLIAFRLTDAWLGPSPPLPWVGSFAETNVRFYSVDDDGRRGVVFASLESERLLFTLGARAALGIPYTWASMSIDHEGDRWRYRSRRRWPGPSGARTDIEARVGPDDLSDDPLSQFLTARWGLHTRHLGRTTFLANTHEPWALRGAELLHVDDQLVAAAGLPGVANRPPDSVLYSAGVTTRFGRSTSARPPP